MATIKSLKADVSNNGPLSERNIRNNRLDEGLMLETSAFKFNSLRWPIYAINSVGKTKLPCYTLPSTQQKLTPFCISFRPFDPASVFHLCCLLNLYVIVCLYVSSQQVLESEFGFIHLFYQSRSICLVVRLSVDWFVDSHAARWTKPLRSFKPGIKDAV